MHNILKSINHPLFKHSGVYLSFSVLAAAISFFILPVLSNFLSVEDVGVIGLFMIILQLLTPLLGLQSNAIIGRSYYVRDDIDTLIPSTVILSAIFLVIFTIICFAVPEEIYKKFSFDRGLMFAALTVAFAAINGAVFTKILQLQKKPLLWGIVTTSSLICSITITFLLLLTTDLTVWARVLGIASGNYITFFLGWYVVSKDLKLRFIFSPEHFRYFFKLGSPLIIVAFAGWGILSLDRLFLENFIGIDAVGIYVMGFSIASVIRLSIMAFSRAWAPYAYENLANSNYKVLFKTSIFVFIFFVCFGLIYCIAGIPLLKLIVDEKFTASFSVVPWIVFGMVLGGLYTLFSPYILHTGKTYVSSVIMVAGISINALLNYFLIQKMGVTGAAVASICAFGLMGGSAVLFSAKTLIFKKTINIATIKEI